jgi:hypothetical protein
VTDPTCEYCKRPLDECERQENWEGRCGCWAIAYNREQADSAALRAELDQARQTIAEMAEHAVLNSPGYGPQPDLDALTRDRIAELQTELRRGPPCAATAGAVDLRMCELNHIRIAAGLEPVE